MAFKTTSEFTNSIRATQFIAATDTTYGLGIPVEHVRSTYGEEAGNAYNDLLAARAAISRVYHRIRKGEL